MKTDTLVFAKVRYWLLSAFKFNFQNLNILDTEQNLTSDEICHQVLKFA